MCFNLLSNVHYQISNFGSLTTPRDIHSAKQLLIFSISQLGILINTLDY